MIETMKTHALPSYDLVYVLSEHNALVLYLCFPNLMPTGSANPSPSPVMNIGINTQFALSICTNNIDAGINIIRDDIT